MNLKLPRYDQQFYCSSLSSYLRYLFTDEEDGFRSFSLILYLLNISLYVIFSLGVISDDILLSLMFVVFVISPLKLKCLLFIFSLPFTMVSVFSFGLTLSLVESILLVICYFISNSTKRNPNFGFTDVFSLFFIIFLLTEGFISYIQERSFTGIGIAVYSLISFICVKQFYINKNDMTVCDKNTVLVKLKTNKSQRKTSVFIRHIGAFKRNRNAMIFGRYSQTSQHTDIRERLQNNKEELSTRFVELIFLGILISTLIGIIYGQLREDALSRYGARYIPGYEGHTVEQFRGTLGTSRFAIFSIVSLIYPLFYVRNKVIKCLLSATLVYFVFKSVSLTAFVVMNLFFLYYIYITDIKTRTKCYATLIIMIGIILIASNWDFLMTKTPIFARVNMSYGAYSEGDINKATTERGETNSLAVYCYSDMSLIRKVFGKQYLGGFDSGRGVERFSHNSYLDMLIYFGYFGMFLLFIKIFLLLMELYYIDRKIFHQFILLKMVFVLIAATVSVFSSPYWFMVVVL